MPMQLNNQQINALKQQMGMIKETFLYGSYGAPRGLMSRDLKRHNEKFNQNLSGMCNCWELILISAWKADLGHTKGLSGINRLIYFVSRKNCVVPLAMEVGA